MTEDDKKRKYLDNWSGTDKVIKINLDYPNCACETATATQTGFGYIFDTEVLRYMVCSTSDVRQNTVSKFRITPKIFGRIFTKGVSIVRMHHTTKRELNHTAEILFNIHQKQSGEKGGVVGIVDFVAKDVRYPLGDNVRKCCVLDTPQEDRPTHSDIICSINSLSDIEKNELMSEMFNKIGGDEAFKNLPMSRILK